MRASFAVTNDIVFTRRHFKHRIHLPICGWADCKRVRHTKYFLNCLKPTCHLLGSLNVKLAVVRFRAWLAVSTAATDTEWLASFTTRETYHAARWSRRVGGRHATVWLQLGSVCNLLNSRIQSTTAYMLFSM
jgi:hypothetical protein